nr:immunoglobulin heavy chain junction region [Macaca mulatta]MOX96059.1 immunoglobulin heavy chain junction region [Macaca mulatta]
CARGSGVLLYYFDNW